MNVRNSSPKKLIPEISEEEIRTIIQKLPVCIIALDEKGQVLFWNDECERITGYSANEVIGNPNWVQLLYPDEAYRQEVIQEWAKRGNNFRHWNVSLKAKSGEERVISWTNISDIYPIAGWQNWAIGIDVTTRYQEEQRLKKNYQSYKLLVDIQHKLRNVHAPEKIASVFLDNLKTIFHYDGGLVLLYNSAKGIAEVVSVKFAHSHYYHADYTIPLNYLRYYEKLRQGQMVYVNDLAVYDKTVKITSLLIKQGMKTGVLLPLRINEEVIGSLSLFSSTELKFSPEQENLLRHAADLLSLVLYNNKLIEQLQTKLIDLEQKSIAQLMELRRSESRLRAQYESIPIPTYTWQKHGEDFILIDYNDMAMAATYGKISEYLGHKASEIYRNIPELVELLHECFDNEISMETQIESVSNQDFSTKYFLIKLAYVAPDLVLMHQEDITEEMHDKQRIRTLEQNLKQQSKKILQLRQQTIFKHVTLLPMIEHYRDTVHQVESLLDKTKDKSLVAAKNQLAETNKLMEPVWEYLKLEAQLFNHEKVWKRVDLTALLKRVVRKEKEKFPDLQSHVYLETTRVMSDGNLLEQLLTLLLDFILRRFPPDRKPIIRIVSTAGKNGQTTLTIRENGNVLPENISFDPETFFSAASVFQDSDLLKIVQARQISNFLEGELQIISRSKEADTFILLLPAKHETHE